MKQTIRQMAEEILQEYTNCYSVEDEEYLGKMLEKFASDVAREIFDAFRDEMRSLIAISKELFNECEDDYYEGKKDAFFTAIIYLDELIKKKYTESEKDDG